jgi:ATPase subunit of ABC transporter with duplicated ATPase domains
LNTILLQNVGYRHADGDSQFQHLNFSLPDGLTGLVGANGVGKSLLGKIIYGEVLPDSGRVSVDYPILYLRQNILARVCLEQSIAEFFGVKDKCLALDNVQQGMATEGDFQTIGDDWLFAQHFQTQLNELGSGLHADKPLSSLSGGELIKLMLAQIFSKAKDVKACLLLDEPSNHLDTGGKFWLSKQLAQLNAPCLLISHDRQLLDQCEYIAQLNADSIELVKGNYQNYSQQKALQDEACQREIQQLKKQRKHAKQQAQRDIEKAQQRAANGQKKGEKGGQPRITLNAKGEKAQSSLAAKQAQHRAKSARLNERIGRVDINDDQRPVNFMFHDSLRRGKRLLNLQNYLSPYIQKPINWLMVQGGKVHLKGQNGCGKSSLLGALQQAAQQPCIERLQINCEVLLLDQYCSFIRADLNLIENVTLHLKTGETSTDGQDIRTLLAANGFRKETVFQLAGTLSGGEKMRLAMLIASCQIDKLLLLDEPDNHLDIASKAQLAQALADFAGSFILVSHDQYFVDECGINEVLNL